MSSSDEIESKFFLAKSEQELFYQKKNTSGLKVVGGCTYLSHLPAKAISTASIPQLKEITKHERYIELGSAVTLSELEDIGERNLPKILWEAVKQSANPFIRNIATIGGNIAAEDHRLSLFSPLLALDAQLELKSQNESRFVAMQNFTNVPDGFIISQIRIPLNDWDISIYERLGPSSTISQESAGFSFLAASEKTALSGIRIAFAGPFSFRCISLENRLLGHRLPLAYNEIESFIQEAKGIFDGAASEKKYAPILRAQFLNLLRFSLEQLT